MTFGSFRLNSFKTNVGVTPLISSNLIATGGTVSYVFTVRSDSYCFLLKNHRFTSSTSTNLVVTSSPTEVATTGGGGYSIVGSGANVFYGILLGGGGAGGGVTTTTGAGGGGAGGRVTTASFGSTVALPTGTYPIVAGAGGTGVSGAAGNTGGSSTAFGLTAAGGVGGGVNASPNATLSPQNTGGAGTNSATSFTSGTLVGTGNRGGSAFGSSTALSRSGGGGGGHGGAGAAGTNGVGGAGGSASLSYAITTVDGSDVALGAGGGGGGTTSGQGGSGGSQLNNGSSSGQGLKGTDGLGEGGGGARNSASTAFAGGAGSNGIVALQYPWDCGFNVSFVTSITSTTGSITLPTVQNGDFAILVDRATNSTTTLPTLVTPTGWTRSVVPTYHLPANTLTTGCRANVSYRILTSSLSSTTVTGMTGTLHSDMIMLIYRSSTGTINGIAEQYAGSVYTAGQITNSALSSGRTHYLSRYLLGSMTRYVSWAAYGCNTAVSTGNRTSTVTTREVASGTRLYVKTYENLDASVAGVDQTYSPTLDDGDNNTFLCGAFAFY